MSDYIYGSSLNAAKSKANYLFEGDFRRRPNQNLSGASRSLARYELLQQAAEQRQNREDCRRKEQAALQIQSLWRGYKCRQYLACRMREYFDRVISKYKLNISKTNNQLNFNEFESLLQEFIIHYHSDKDEFRFKQLIQLIDVHHDHFLGYRSTSPNIWLHRLIQILRINLVLLNRHCSSQQSLIYLSFLERFSRLGEILNNQQAIILWRSLVNRHLYETLRKLVDVQYEKRSLEGKIDSDDDIDETVLELVRRSLDLAQDPSDIQHSGSLVFHFFNQFLKGPLNNYFDSIYLPSLLKLRPQCLRPDFILSEFDKTYRNRKCNLSSLTSMTDFSGCIANTQKFVEAIWFCYSFVKTIYSQMDQLDDQKKGVYLDILSVLIEPAELMTNVSLMHSAHDRNDESNEDAATAVTQISQGSVEIHNVITKLINLINHLPHINSLKPIIFAPRIQPQIQSALVRICNLMLSHKHLAIFNCRLLYTVAFSKEFSRSLWKSILSSTSSSLYGSNTPIYTQIIRSGSISDESWKLILPRLNLFCSLCSYILPTLDDGEFYSDDDLIGQSDSHMLQSKHSSDLSKSSSIFMSKELINISAILRDICVGFIDILYQSNRYCRNQASTNVPQDEHSRLVSFEKKICFKAVVRLICQIHARDSRKPFCPSGHWICPSVIIPANKAIDFQLVTSQQGRILDHITESDLVSDKSSTTTSSEIKTVLILQEIPFITSFQDRVMIFHQLLKKERQAHQSDGYHFGLPGTAIQIQVRRNYVYEDAFEKLSPENEPNLKLPLKISLINAAGVSEAGIDGGGLSKEFLSELLRAGFDPMRGFFKATKNNLLYPNPSANVLFSNLIEGYEVHYEFLGKMLGKAIFEKIMVELPLAGFFLAKILAVKHSSDVDLHNLESLDPILYKNLVYLKNYSGDVADLNLDFTIANNDLGEHEVVELKPGGSKIPVTKDNKIEYVHLVADYRLNKQIRAQCAAFKRGLAQLIDLDWLRMFDPRELLILISGAPTTIDVDDWRRHTIYANGYSDDCEAINIFWRVVGNLDENQKRKLLKFTTSCSLPPLLGFKDLFPQFAISPSEGTRLPTASTCMNLLKLPECKDETTMRSKLLYAIESNSGFELS